MGTRNRLPPPQRCRHSHTAGKGTKRLGGGVWGSHPLFSRGKNQQLKGTSPHSGLALPTRANLQPAPTVRKEACRGVPQGVPRAGGSAGLLALLHHLKSLSPLPSPPPCTGSWSGS